MYGYEELAMNIYHPDKLPPDEADDLAWHALNYRTAGIRQADEMWEELAACVERKLAAERERCATLCFAKMPKPAAKWSDVEMTEALRQVAEAIRAGDTAP